MWSDKHCCVLFSEPVSDENYKYKLSALHLNTAEEQSEARTKERAASDSES